jgi:cytochrome c oxidase subunit II
MGRCKSTNVVINVQVSVTIRKTLRPAISLVITERGNLAFELRKNLYLLNGLGSCLKACGEGSVKKLSALLAVSGLMGVGEVSADYTLNLTEGVTELSRDIHDLHMAIFWICVAIGVIVYGLLIYSLVNHRKSKGVIPAQFHENTKLEILWTVIPFLILIGMAIPATKVMIKVYDSSGADMTIKVTGYQWKWKYEYLDEGVSFFSTLDAKSNEARQMNSGVDPATVENYLLEVDHPLVLPVGKKIRFLFTGGDVIHSWWVPDLGWKKDTIPGFITDGWARVEKAGTYRGQCTELCGRDHGFMPIVVIAKPDVEYKQWLAEQKGGGQPEKAGIAKEAGDELAAVAEAVKDQNPAESGKVSEESTNQRIAASVGADKDMLMTLGHAVYEGHCISCHQAGGEGIEGMFPAIKGSAVVTGPVSGHIDLILNGKAPLMASFRNVLKPEEIAAVITYQRNALGNNTGDIVQASDVASHQ